MLYFMSERKRDSCVLGVAGGEGGLGGGGGGGGRGIHMLATEECTCRRMQVSTSHAARKKPTTRQLTRVSRRLFYAEAAHSVRSRY